MFFHTFQLFTIAIMFCPGLWVTPPRPPDAPPPSRRVVAAYKVVGGFALSQVIWFIPSGSRCQRDSLCGMLREYDSLPARSTLRLGTARRLPPPVSRPHISSLLKTTCPVVIIPPRPAPTCQNTGVYPTFGWAPQSPAPSLALAQRSCSLSLIPIFHGDERTYIHPTISPYPLPRPTDVAPNSCALLIVVWMLCRNILGHILAIVYMALTIVAKLMVRVGGTRYSSGLKCILEALSKAEWRTLLTAFKIFGRVMAVGVLGWFYLIGDVNVNLVLAAAFVVGKMSNDVVTLLPAIVRKMWTSLLVFYKDVTLQAVKLGARGVYCLSGSSRLVDAFEIWMSLVAYDDVTTYKDVVREILKLVIGEVSRMSVSSKLADVYAIWTSLTTTHKEVASKKLNIACRKPWTLVSPKLLDIYLICEWVVVAFSDNALTFVCLPLKLASPRPIDATYLPNFTLFVVDMNANNVIARDIMAACGLEGVRVISPATNESGIDETAAEYNVSTALTDEEHRTLWVLLLILISQTGDNVQAQVVDCGTDEDITPTPTTPPTALPTFSSFTSVPAPEPSLITDDVAPAEPEDALDPDLELIIEPTPVIHDAVPDFVKGAQLEDAPKSGSEPVPESSAVAASIAGEDITDVKPALPEDTSDREMGQEPEPAPIPELSAVATAVVDEDIPDTSEPEPALELSVIAPAIIDEDTPDVTPALLKDTSEPESTLEQEQELDPVPELSIVATAVVGGDTLDVAPALTEDGPGPEPVLEQGLETEPISELSVVATAVVGDDITDNIEEAPESESLSALVPKPIAEPEVEPIPEVTPVVEDVAVPQSRDTLKSELEPEVEPIPEPSVVAALVIDEGISEDVGEAPEPRSEPEPELVPKPVPEPEAEPIPEFIEDVAPAQFRATTKLEPELEIEPIPEPPVVAAPVIDEGPPKDVEEAPKPELVPKPVLEPGAEPIPDIILVVVEAIPEDVAGSGSGSGVSSGCAGEVGPMPESSVNAAPVIDEGIPEDIEEAPNPEPDSESILEPAPIFEAVPDNAEDTPKREPEPEPATPTVDEAIHEDTTSANPDDDLNAPGSVPPDSAPELTPQDLFDISPSTSVVSIEESPSECATAESADGKLARQRRRIRRSVKRARQALREEAALVASKSMAQASISSTESTQPDPETSARGVRQSLSDGSMTVASTCNVRPGPEPRTGRRRKMRSSSESVPSPSTAEQNPGSRNEGGKRVRRS